MSNLQPSNNTGHTSKHMGQFLNARTKETARLVDAGSDFVVDDIHPDGRLEVPKLVIERIGRIYSIISSYPDEASMVEKIASFRTWSQGRFPDQNWKALTSSQKEDLIQKVESLGGDTLSLRRKMDGFFGIADFQYFYTHAEKSLRQGGTAREQVRAKEAFEKGEYLSKHCKY